jgi:hypothetical protein
MGNVNNIWILNLVTSGAFFAAVIWLLHRFISSFDKRLSDNEQKTEKIEKNYIQKFNEVNKTIAQSEKNIRDHFTHEINDVIRDKSAYRIQQSRAMGIIETKLDNLTELLKR